MIYATRAKVLGILLLLSVPPVHAWAEQPQTAPVALDPMDFIQIVDAKVVRVEPAAENIALYTAYFEVTQVYCGAKVQKGTIFQAPVDIGAGSRNGYSLVDVPKLGESGIWKINEYVLAEGEPGIWKNDKIYNAEYPFPARRGIDRPEVVDAAHMVAIALGQVWEAKPEVRPAIIDKMVTGDNSELAAVMVRVFAQLKPAGWLETLERWTNNPKVSITAQIAADRKLLFAPLWARSDRRHQLFARWMRADVSERDADAIYGGLWSAMNDRDYTVPKAPPPRVIDAAFYLDLVRDALANPAFRLRGTKSLGYFLQFTPRMIDDRSSGFKFLTTTMSAVTEPELLRGCAGGIRYYAPLSPAEASVVGELLKQTTDKDAARLLGEALAIKDDQFH